MNDDQLINKKFHILQRGKILNDPEKFIYNEIGNRIILSLEGIKLSLETCLEIGPSSNKIYYEILSKFNQIDYFVFHQANKFMLKGLQRKMKIPNNRIIIDMKNTGNTTSSSIPIVMKKYEKKFQKGNKILLAGFGGGLSWGICLLKKC